MHDAVKYIHDNGHILREEHAKCDERGKLTDRTVQVLRDSGGIKLLQAKDSGGYEAAPTDFYEWVRAVAQYNPSAGWVAGVIGIHPWEIALMDAKLQAEIYGEKAEKAETWVSSPYAPVGALVPVEGGYRFTTNVTYGTGSDFCDWAILAGVVIGEDGKPTSMPPDMRHVVLPRADYEIVEGSWNTMGLIGTGSKNIKATDVFIPEYRVLSGPGMVAGEYGVRREGNALYQMAFAVTFSFAIVSATFGIARGTIDAYREYLKSRVSAVGVVGKQDPFQQEALAEAEADLAAGIAHVDAMTAEMYNWVAAGNTISYEQRLEWRRNQARAAQRVLDSVDRLVRKAGSAAVWTDKPEPVERFWRDLMTGGSHVCNVTDTIYTAWANTEFQTGGPTFTFA